MNVRDTELERLRRRCANQRRELKRLNRKMRSYAEGPQDRRIFMELGHELSKQRERTKVAEKRVADLERLLSHDPLPKRMTIVVAADASEEFEREVRESYPSMNIVRETREGGARRADNSETGSWSVLPGETK